MPPGLWRMMTAANQRTTEPWRVGILFSRRGFMAVIEETQLRGTLLAIDEVNAAGGINGRKLIPVTYDPASVASAFGQYAKRLMIEDGVTTIFGCYTSSSRKSVLPVVERLNGLLWYPTLYEGFEFSPNVIYTGAAPNQNSVALCRFLLENYGRRAFFIGSDYIYPRESNRIMRELVSSAGGEVIGEAYLGLRAERRDFLPVLREVRMAHPDFIFSTVVGDATTFLYQTYADMNLSPKHCPVASLTTTEAEIRAMGPDVAEGHLTAAPYFESISGRENSSFVTRYKAQYGDDAPTNMCVEAAYFQVKIFAKALEQTNSLMTDVLRPVVLGSEFDAPQGKVRIDPRSNHTDVRTRIGRANDHGQFEVVWDSFHAVPADPYLIGSGRTTALSCCQ